MSRYPSVIARLMDDGSTQLYRYQYNDFQRVTQATDPLGRVTTFPDGSYTEVDYTHLDVEWLRDREGNWTHRLTNQLRQTVASIDARGSLTQFGYCKCGQLVQIVDPNGNMTQWKLDAADGVDESYGFDGLGRLQSDTNALGTFTYGYDGTMGRLGSVLYPNGVQALYAYQESNAQDRRLSQIKHLLPSGAVLDQFDYAYAGPLGRISRWGQQQPGAVGTLVTNNYDLFYDAVGHGSAEPPL